jgi:PadR family transcriptional regulator, regulatory protein AphA
MSLKYGLLGILNYGSATGYDLKKTFDSSLNFFWQAHKSQIYKELTSLEKEGYLSVESVVQHDRPNRKVYTLTGRGREEFLRWLRSNLSDGDFQVRDTFLMKVFFWGELDREEARLKLEAYRRIHENKLESYRAAAGHIRDYSALVDREKARFWEFTARYGYRHSENCIEWADEAIRLLEEGENHD